MRGGRVQGFDRSRRNAAHAANHIVMNSSLAYIRRKRINHGSQSNVLRNAG